MVRCFIILYWDFLFWLNYRDSFKTIIIITFCFLKCICSSILYFGKPHFGFCRSKTEVGSSFCGGSIQIILWVMDGNCFVHPANCVHLTLFHFLQNYPQQNYGFVIHKANLYSTSLRIDNRYVYIDCLRMFIRIVMHTDRQFACSYWLSIQIVHTDWQFICS